ncbi:hypothetical protein [Ornithinimicrobium panacihumi]|uniref:hypothetical protein n=1 Tax=Ornithinimicrobium panacihumi TaxID=2008449 RepID=UPI003F8CEB6E
MLGASRACRCLGCTRTPHPRKDASCAPPWLERGLTSKEEAFAVGIELETADIADLAWKIEDVDDARVVVDRARAL